MKSPLGLHKGQLHVSSNFQNINLPQFIEAMFKSVSFFTIDKHLVMITTAENGHLKYTSKMGKIWNQFYEL